MDIDTVLFDLDDTLCTHVVPPARQLAELFERTGVEPFFDHAAIHRTAATIDASSAAEFERELYTKLAAANDQPAAVAERLIDDEPPYDPTNVRFRAGAERLLATVSDTYSVGLVTNGAEQTQRQKLERLGIESLFDTMVFAGDRLPTKPSTEPFERALRGLGTAPAQTVHVGDSLHADVAGAHASQLESVWTPLHQPLPDTPSEYETVHGVSRPSAAITALDELESVLL